MKRSIKLAVRLFSLEGITRTHPSIANNGEPFNQSSLPDMRSDYFGLSPGFVKSSVRSREQAETGVPRLEESERSSQAFVRVHVAERGTRKLGQLRYCDTGFRKQLVGFSLNYDNKHVTFPSLLFKVSKSMNRALAKFL